MKRISLVFAITVMMGCGAVLVQTETAPPITEIEQPVSPDEVDWIRGGSLYDKWWKSSDAPAPTGNHPLWASRPDQTTNTRTGATTRRCKECHGWDYKGDAGVYGGNSHKTGFPGILQARSMGDAELFDSIANKHGYLKAGLSDKDIHDLVSFVQKGTVDLADYVDDKAAFIGDGEKGKPAYADGSANQSGCTDCHDDDGLAVVSEGFDDFPGYVGKKNPWELLHKIRFGQPGTGMPAYGLDFTPQELRDLGAHIQTLPVKPAP